MPVFCSTGSRGAPPSEIVNGRRLKAKMVPLGELLSFAYQTRRAIPNMRALRRVFSYLASAPEIGFVIRGARDEACFGHAGKGGLVKGGTLIIESITHSDWAGCRKAELGQRHMRGHEFIGDCTTVKMRRQRRSGAEESLAKASKEIGPHGVDMSKIKALVPLLVLMTQVVSVEGHTRGLGLAVVTPVMVEIEGRLHGAVLGYSSSGTRRLAAWIMVAWLPFVFYKARKRGFIEEYVERCKFENLRSPDSGAEGILKRLPTCGLGDNLMGLLTASDPEEEGSKAEAFHRGHQHLPDRQLVMENLRHCCRVTTSISLDHPEYKTRYQLYGMLQGKSMTPMLPEMPEGEEPQDGAF
ncbi:hypothetical protein AK812_SmicGene40278 [Symbiodinium microadriaticum]|uniref:Uncharacterized protein n=1 Tax=Symbiodinium microadriaticum TaxID=2951 RepID=A0A1Q9C917_SYMMI|nr:hypothetical protein AK812_SmicGene40278 [Symbiodinium microadriaticum]